METIKLNKSIYEQDSCFCGYESNLYKDGDLMYKIYKVRDKKMMDNKIKKLEILHDMDIDEAKPLYLIMIDDQYVGYAMKNFEGYSKLNCFEKKINVKIRNLQELQRKLKILHKNGIVFGDLDLSNVLEKNGRIVLCDLDNIKIGNLDFDATTYCENIYLQHFEADKYLDAYMFNLLCISYFSRVVLPYCIDYAHRKGLPFALDTIQNKKVLDSMIKLDDKENIKLFTKNMKRHQII